MRKQLSIKQKRFVKVLVKTGNATEAAVQAYNAKDRMIARNIGSENLAKPVIQHALQEHESLFTNAITAAVEDWSTEEDTAKRSLAVNTAKWGYEQIHGKATQRTESVSASFIQHTSTKAKEYGL